MRLYAITDRSWLDGRSLAECVQQAIDGGATCVQLREKQADFSEIETLAYEIKELCAQSGIPFIVNDALNIAKKVGADGIHVGQDDVTCTEARSVLGAHAIIGVSVQTLEEARAEEAAGADYLGVGAMFGTPTKPEAVDVTMSTLREICASVTIPVVAIGGLNLETIPKLADTGVDGVAVVSAIFAAQDIKTATTVLRACAETL